MIMAMQPSIPMTPKAAIRSLVMVDAAEGVVEDDDDSNAAAENSGDEGEPDAGGNHGRGVTSLSGGDTSIHSISPLTGLPTCQRGASRPTPIKRT